MTDSISLYLNRAGAGWPANTGIRTPTQVEPLAGGFVEMDNEDVAVYSAYGAKIRTIQPGYAARRWPWATPALCCITAQARS